MSSSRVRMLFLVALLCAMPALASDAGRERPPNIVLIVADDYGYPYAGFMGDKIVETPNLDRLAEEGTTFTHAYSSATVCRPALQTLLTGLHTRSWSVQRSRVEEATGELIPHRGEVQHFVTLPRQLARQGYRSFQGGKHWEGDFAMAGYDAGTADIFYSHPVRISGVEFACPSLSPMHDFLDGVEEDEPFFLFLAPRLPHQPWDASIQLKLHYLAKGLSPTAVFYYANITRFDEMVGRMIDALEERGLRDDSLIIYLSDNGWEQAPYETHFLGIALGGDRGKQSIYELGFRTPLIFNWPDRVPAGKRLNDLVSFEDVHATILKAAGAPLPPDHEGIDLMPRVEGRGEPARDHIIGIRDRLRVRASEYTGLGGLAGSVTSETSGFLRTDRWRYIEWLDRGEQALFEIEEDPFERNDVSGEYPDLLPAFADQTRMWRENLAKPAAWMDFMGRLMSEDGTPAAGLRLWLEGASESGGSAQMAIFSDDRGFFRFPNVRAGEYTLTHEVESSGAIGRWLHTRRRPVTESREIALVGYETGPFLSIQIPGEVPTAPTDGRRPGTIEVELLARTATQAIGLPVRLRGWTARGLVELRVLSGPDGFVAVDQLPAGIYFIKVSTPLGIRNPTRWVYLRQGANESLRIRLRKGTRKHGTARSWFQARTRR